MTPHDLEAKLAQAPVGYAVLEGPDSVFVSANARYLEMVGRDAGAVGRAWADVFPELVGTPTEGAVRAASRGERVEVHEFSVPLVREGLARDAYFNFSLDPTRTASGEVTGFVVLAVDVTELVQRRREAEALAADLLVREERYRTIFAAMDEGYCLMQMLFDGDGSCVDYRFLELNDAFLRHTGFVEPLGKRRASSFRTSIRPGSSFTATWRSRGLRPASRTPPPPWGGGSTCSRAASGPRSCVRWGSCSRT